MLNIKQLASIVFFALMLYPLLSHAETCPTPRDLQMGNYQQWRLLNLDDAEPLSAEDVQTFQTNVHSFALAEWMSSAPEGSGHCYYEGDTPDSTFLGAFLAKAVLRPSAPAWRQMNEDVAQCTASVESCLF